MQNAPVGKGSSISSTAGDGEVVVEPTRPRQTERPTSPFRDVLASGTAILVRGAEVATSVAAGPVLAAAVRESGTAAAGAIAGTGTARGPGVMATAGTATAATTTAAAGATAGTSNVPASLMSAGGDQSDLATMQAMQRESQVFNVQLLELQEDVQQENRRFSTVSNVLRAKHDTAKAAVSNIRA
jgi:hypothetical protein